jgi:lysophospholipase L1-like esterase
MTGSPAPPAVFTRYVALGDSFTEGVGDPHPASPNGLRGWADHVAVALAQNHPALRYANLAVRGRRMDEILAEQVQTAVMLEPDLVTVYAGMNDLLLVRNDIDAMMSRYADGLKTLQQTGAHVLAFTAGDLGTVPLFRRLRGRAAVYNELLRGIADDLGLQLVDFWRFTEFRDPRLWAGDRIHLSPLGHERMAAKVLDTLTVSHNLPTRSAALLASSSPARSFWANLQWALAFAAPWVAKRLRRVTPGAGVEPKYPALARIG